MKTLPFRIAYAAFAAACLLVIPACDSGSPVGTDSLAEAAGKGKGKGGGSRTSLSVSPTQVDFGTTATSTSVTLKNSSRKTLSWTASESASWLALGGTSGTIPARSSRTLSLSGARGGLGAGTYSTTVTVAASDGGSRSLPVSLTVASSGGSSGQLAVSPGQVDFGSATTSSSVTLTNGGDASLTWTATESAGWLSLGATAGTVAAHSSKTVALSAQRGGMQSGTYTTMLVVAAGSAGADTTSVSMTVASSTSLLLSGRLVDQFGGQGMGGLTVQFRGSTAVTDGSGRFSIPGSPTSTLSDLTLSGPGVHTRRTFARTEDGDWRVLPASFDMGAYNDVARQEFGPSTVRWVAPPTVYVDTRPEGFTAGPELNRWIGEVQAQAAGFVSEWTGARMAPAGVVVTSNPPKDLAAGTIVIHFSEDDARYGNSSSTIGYARLSWSSQRTITGAAVWLRYLRYSGDGYASKRTGILGHELGHAMGMSHMDGAMPSFMRSSIGSNTDLSPFDMQAALLLYTRAPGNTAPDTDSATGFSLSGGLTPAQASGFTEWVCRDEADTATP